MREYYIKNKLESLYTNKLPLEKLYKKQMSDFVTTECETLARDCEKLIYKRVRERLRQIYHI